jgi:hypothetical protein
VPVCISVTILIFDLEKNKKVIKNFKQAITKKSKTGYNTAKNLLIFHKQKGLLL